MKPAIKFLDISATEDKIGHSRSHIHELLNTKSPRHDKSFPRPIRIGNGKNLWVESELDAWMEEQIQRFRSAS